METILISDKTKSQSSEHLAIEEKRTIARRVLKNFLSLSGASFICKALAYVSTAYLARVLGTEGFGILGFAQAAIVYFQLLLNQGLDTYGTREIAKHSESTKRYLNNILTIRLVLSSISYILLIVFVAVIPKPTVVKSVIIILGLKLFANAFNIKWVFQGIEKMEWIAASRIIPQAVFVAGVFILIRTPEHILAVPVLHVVTASIGAVTLILIYIKSFKRPGLSFEPAFWKEIFAQSIPMGATYLLIQIYTNFDMLVLGFTHGESVVGLYSAAYKVILIINLFGIYYFTTLFPNISRMYSQSQEQLKNLLERSMKFVSLFAIPICVGGTILARPIMTFIYGREFAMSALPFKILIWNVAVIWLSLHYGNTLMASNRQKLYLLAVGIGAAINIVLNLIFIPRFGMIAAAITTLTSEIAVLLIASKRLKEMVRLNIPKLFLKPLIASTAMALAIYIMPEWNVVILICLAAFVYLATALAIGALKVKELGYLK